MSSHPRSASGASSVTGGIAGMTARELTDKIALIDGVRRSDHTSIHREVIVRAVVEDEAAKEHLQSQLEQMAKPVRVVIKTLDELSVSRRESRPRPGVNPK